MASLFVRFKNSFRHIIDGVGERCPECNKPINYIIAGSEYRPRSHRCRNRPPGRIKQGVLDDGENDQEDEDLCEGARIERGFQMMAMGNDLDYCGIDIQR